MAAAFRYDECPQQPNPTVIRTNTDTSFKRIKGPILASLATTAGSFAVGSVMSWTSVALPDLKKNQDLGPLSPEQESWIGSIIALGALIAGPLTGLAIERWGRKITLLGVNVPLLLGWILIIFAINPMLVIIGRFITGIAVGCLTIVIPIYITECTEEHLRGVIASTFPIMWAVGILSTNLAGYINISWFWLSVMYAFAPILLFTSMLFVVESPIYYIRVGRESDAKKSLKWLRSVTSEREIYSELAILSDNINDGADGGGLKLRDFMQRPVLKPSIIIVTIFIFQQFSGFNAVVFYMVDIFEAAGGMDATLSSMIVSIMNLFAVFVTSAVTDKAGRKLLLMISSGGLALSLTALGVFFYLKEEGGDVEGLSSWLPLTSLLFFMVSFNVGMGPMPFLVMAEIIPSHVKGVISPFAVSVMWFLTFLITKTFDGMSNALGAYGCFWLFASISAIGLFFTLVFVKETKGKNVAQIYKLYS